MGLLEGSIMAAFFFVGVVAGVMVTLQCIDFTLKHSTQGVLRQELPEQKAKKEDREDWEMAQGATYFGFGGESDNA